jgi:hypothetical protein
MKRSADLRTAIAELWSDDARVREAAANRFADLVDLDLVDIRSAQPALTVALADPDPGVRKAACRATSVRADLGGDVGMGVPALFRLTGDENAETREFAWRALYWANRRFGDATLVCMAGTVRAALDDPDPVVRRYAENILGAWPSG